MKTPLPSGRLLLCGVVLLLFSGRAAPRLLASDWPQYRGPNHDGISTETIRTNWSAEAPRQIWKVSLDPGLSSLSISGGRIFTLVRPAGALPTTEYCVALDANTGNEMWRTPVGVANYPNGGVGSDDGPRSTPSVDGGRVYVLATYLNLLCLNATNGSVVWSNNLSATYGGTVIAWENAASPVIEGDLIFMNCNAPNNRLLALHKSDGSEAWKGQDDAMTQATPVVATIAGLRQVIFFAQSGLVSVVPETGLVLWRYPFSYSTSTAASPVVGNDVVYCSAAYGTGSGAVRVTGSGPPLSATQVWRRAGANQNHWATPVYHGGHVYGVYGQASPTATLRCIDLATGNETWRRTTPVGMGSILQVAGNLLVLTEDGYLLLARPDPSQYVELESFRALDGSRSSIPGLDVKCWNAPAISNGRLYVRSTTEAVCLDVAVAAPAPLKLEPLLSVANGAFRLLIGNEDGSPIDSNRVARIDVFAATNLGTASNDWAKLTNSLVLTNGQLRLDDPQSPTRPRRFFRTEERP